MILDGDDYLLIKKDCKNGYIYHSGQKAFTASIKSAKKYYSLSTALADLTKNEHENNVRLVLVKIKCIEISINIMEIS